MHNGCVALAVEAQAWLPCFIVNLYKRRVQVTAIIYRKIVLVSCILMQIACSRGKQANTMVRAVFTSMPLRVCF